MGLTPSAGVVGQACRRALPLPVMLAIMVLFLLLVRPDGWKNALYACVVRRENAFLTCLSAWADPDLSSTMHSDRF